MSAVDYDGREWLREISSLADDLKLQKDSLCEKVLAAEAKTASKEAEVTQLLSKINSVLSDCKKRQQKVEKENKEALDQWKNAGKAYAASVRAAKLSQQVKSLGRVEHLFQLGATLYFSLNDREFRTAVESFCQIQDVTGGKSTTKSRDGGLEKLQELAQTMLSALTPKTARACEEFARNYLDDDVRYPFADEVSAVKENRPEQIFQKFLEACKGLFLADSDALIDCLADPFEIKFSFHFHGQEKTNDIEKPEWFLTQTLNWLKVHFSFWFDELKPLNGFIRTKNSDFALKEKIVDRILALPAKKIDSDLPKTTSDVVIFSHLVDEVVIFQEELAKFQLDHASNVVEVLIEDQTALNLWLSIEQSCVSEELDRFLESDRAWEHRPESDRVPNFCESYVLLLNGMLRRYSRVRDASTRLKFFSLESNLLDDLRLRLLSMTSGMSSVWQDRYLSTMNAAGFLANTLRQWNMAPFFIQLQALRHGYVPLSLENQDATTTTPDSDSDRLAKDRSESRRTAQIFVGDEAFGKFVGLYTHMIADMTDTIVNDVLLPELGLALQPYKQLKKWFSSGSENPLKRVDQTSLDDTGSTHHSQEISEEYFPFLILLQQRISYVLSKLSSSLMAKFMNLFCSRLAIQYKSLLLQMNFNQTGAKQFEFDFKTGFLPLLHIFEDSATASIQSTSKSAKRLSLLNHFQELLEIMRLLGTKTSSLILLYEALKTPGEDTRSILREFDCESLDAESACEAIRLRVDAGDFY